ncbi:MAG: hypothetical protein VB858_16225, partial [Planctomycetaceae bacterium]
PAVLPITPPGNSNGSSVQTDDLRIVSGTDAATDRDSTAVASRAGPDGSLWNGPGGDNARSTRKVGLSGRLGGGRVLEGNRFPSTIRNADVVVCCEF